MLDTKILLEVCKFKSELYIYNIYMSNLLYKDLNNCIYLKKNNEIGIYYLIHKSNIENDFNIINYNDVLVINCTVDINSSSVSFCIFPNLKSLIIDSYTSLESLFLCDVASLEDLSVRNCSGLNNISINSGLKNIYICDNSNLQNINISSSNTFQNIEIKNNPLLVGILFNKI